MKCFLTLAVLTLATYSLLVAVSPAPAQAQTNNGYPRPVSSATFPAPIYTAPVYVQPIYVPPVTPPVYFSSNPNFVAPGASYNGMYNNGASYNFHPRPH